MAKRKIIIGADIGQGTDNSVIQVYEFNIASGQMLLKAQKVERLTKMNDIDKRSKFRQSIEDMKELFEVPDTEITVLIQEQ